MSAMASQITSLAIVYSTVYSGTDQRQHQSSASLAFVLGIHLCPVNSPHNWPVTRKMFPFDDVIMTCFGNPSAFFPFYTTILSLQWWDFYINWNRHWGYQNMSWWRHQMVKKKRWDFTRSRFQAWAYRERWTTRITASLTITQATLTMLACHGNR